MVVLEARGLTKTYPNGARGLVDLDLAIEEGEVFGFLGPNGAGKTTTMRLFLDLIRPTAGEALVFGMDARRDREAIHARIGALGSEPGLGDRRTARQELRDHSALRGRDDAPAVEALAGRFLLDLDRRVRQLSHGNRQKVAIVRAFAHEPDLLFLDEPTSGLDPLMQQEFNRLVRERARAGATIFLSSHILPEVEALCDRVAVVRGGRLVAVEDVASLKRRAVRRVRVRFATPRSPRDLDGIEGVEGARQDGELLVCAVRGPTGPLVRALAEMGAADVSIAEASLEDAFLGLYGEDAA